MNPLAIVQLLNSGVLIWDAAGPLLERVMDGGEEVTIDELVDASEALGQALDELKIAALRAKAEGR